MRFLSRLLRPAPAIAWEYSADQRARHNPATGAVQAWFTEDMDEFHGGYWRDVDACCNQNCDQGRRCPRRA